MVPEESPESGTAAGVREARERLAREIPWLAWQTLFVLSGTWLEAAIRAERFCIDLARDAEERRPRPEDSVAGRWAARIVDSAWAATLRVVRWCEPRARGWRRSAARADAALLARRGPG